MDVYERRQARLKELLVTTTAADLARASKVDPSYISRALLAPGSKGHKNIGEITARKLERGAHKHVGWMDEITSSVHLAHRTPLEVRETAASYQTGTEVVAIRQFDAGGGMGGGKLLLDDQPGIIRSWEVDEDWLRLNVRGYTSIQNLCIVTGFGPSMRPMFNPGDPLLVDTGVTSVETDAVYFFRVDGHGYIKVLQRIPTSGGTMLRAKSKNPDYDPFDIDVRSMDFEVLGKVLTVWKSEQF